MQQNIEAARRRGIGPAQHHAGLSGQTAGSFHVTRLGQSRETRQQQIDDRRWQRRCGPRANTLLTDRIAHHVPPSRMPKWLLASGAIISGVQRGS